MGVNTQRGKPKSGGAAPYGYRRTEQGFEPDPTEAPIRSLIFDLFLTHKRKLTTAKILNQKGYRTRSGAKFSDSSIDRFLRDPIAKGHHKDNYRPVRGPKKYRLLKPATQWRFPRIEPLVDEATWNHANDILIAQRKKPVAKKPRGVFTGLTYCACGAHMHQPHQRKSYFCSACDNSITVDTIESIFAQKLADFPIGKQTLAKLKKGKEGIKAQGEQIELLAERKRAIESEMDKLYRLYIDNTISKTRFSKKHKPLEQCIEEIDAELKLLRSESGETTAPKTLEDVWAACNPDKRNQLVHEILNRIVVDRTSININYSVPPDFLSR